MIRNKYISFLVAVLVIAGVSLALKLSAPHAEKAPFVEFTLLDGARVGIKELEGKTVLINFWATSCEPCLKEIPALLQLYDELRPLGLEIIGVAMPYDPPARVVEFSLRHGISYPVALDIEGHVTRAFGGVSLIPTTFLIAPKGRIVLHRTGLLEMAQVRRTIVELLKMKPT